MTNKIQFDRIEVSQKEKTRENRPKTRWRKNDFRLKKRNIHLFRRNNETFKACGNKIGSTVVLQLLLMFNEWDERQSPF